MGGSVGLTIREPDGKEHRMCRSTGVLPWAIRNMRLVNKDPEHIRAVLKDWEKMRDDYERNKTSGHFEIEMTDCYAPYPFLAPINYGLVVVDMVNNEILDYQGYTSPADSVDAIAALNDISSVKVMHGFEEAERWGEEIFDVGDDKINAVRFKEFFEAGRVLEAKQNYPTRATFDIKGKSLHDLIELMQEHVDAYFILDTSPFKVTAYKEHDPEEAMKMKMKLKELGFELSDEEEQIWTKWIKKEYG